MFDYIQFIKQTPPALPLLTHSCFFPWVHVDFPLQPSGNVTCFLLKEYDELWRKLKAERQTTCTVSSSYVYRCHSNISIQGKKLLLAELVWLQHPHFWSALQELLKFLCVRRLLWFGFVSDPWALCCYGGAAGLGFAALEKLGLGSRVQSFAHVIG